MKGPKSPPAEPAAQSESTLSPGVPFPGWNTGAHDRAGRTADHLGEAVRRGLRGDSGRVNSPVRAFNAVGGTPRFITSAQGCWLTDADGNRYVDLVCSWGPMILGHAHPAIVEAVQQAAAKGLSFGAPTPVRPSWPPRSSTASPRCSECGW